MTPVTCPPSIQHVNTEASKHSGALWHCLFRATDLFAGYRYTFRLKEEYDDVTPQDPQIRQNRRLAALQKRKEIVPAGEYLGSEIRYFTPECLYAPSFQALGYEMKVQKEGVFLVLPDKEAILSRWKFLKISRRELPNLKILSHPGLADDHTFIKAFCSHDALLSCSSHFIHDHFHLLRTLILMFDSGRDDNPTYGHERRRLVKLIKQAYRPIQQAEKLLGHTPTTRAIKELATQVDYIWARQGYEESQAWTKECESLLPLWKEIDALSSLLTHTKLQDE